VVANLTPQNIDLGGRGLPQPEGESGPRDQIDQSPQNNLEQRNRGFMMPHRLAWAWTVAIE